MSALRSLSSLIRPVRDNVLPLFYEEPEVARYVVVAESAGGLSVPDPETSISDRHIGNLDAPGLLDGSRPVILFRTAHAGKPSFSVRLNTTRLTQHTFVDSGPHSWHEIVPAGALRAVANELTFAVGGEGSVTFSDAVILYTSNQLTVRKRLPQPEILQ